LNRSKQLNDLLENLSIDLHFLVVNRLLYSKE
jgi:hypothetical protein